jgi:hypothetical protein
MPFKNKEDRLKYSKKYRQEHREKLNKDKIIYYNNNKNVINEKKNIKYKIMSDEDKENLKNNHKQYYINNKIELLKKQKEYAEDKKDKIKEYNKEYAELNKEYFKEKSKEYSKCRSCKLFSTNKRTKYLCSYCNPEKSKHQKTKEMRVKTFLEENNYTFIHNKKCNLDNSCQTYYPDFLIDCNTFFLIIECDENSHSSYDINCEKIRENNICYALGLPCVFIRYNPDKKKIQMKIKEKVLKSYIEYYKNKIICNNEVVYLFYK